VKDCERQVIMTRTSKKVANPEKYTGKAYLTYDESTDFLGISLSSLIRYIADERIQTLKFHRDKRRYLKIEDVKRIKDLMEKPWMRTAPQESQISGVNPPSERRLVAEERLWYSPEQKEEGMGEQSEPDAA
jgi:hypothetical protein